jgi:glutathione S-transferase
MLQILGKSTSINVRKVLWLCEELGLPYELQQWGSGHRSTDAPEFRVLNPAHTDPASIAAGIHSWNRHMTLLDGQLRQTGAFATGARFTLADIVLGLSTHRWFTTPMERPALPAVAAYYERSSQRPAFMAHGRNGVP